MPIRYFRKAATRIAALLVTAALVSTAAGADQQQIQTTSASNLANPDKAVAESSWEARLLVQGHQFSCMDGSKMLLAFQNSNDGVDALIHVQDRNYMLPAQPSGSGEVRILWSDGVNSLTWSPGVQLMWMSGATHLMCGRSHHH